MRLNRIISRATVPAAMCLLLSAISLTTQGTAAAVVPGFDDPVQACKRGCKDNACKMKCLHSDTSHQSIVERTQKCQEDCKAELDTLQQVCVRKCTLFLAGPAGHDLDTTHVFVPRRSAVELHEEPSSSVRLIGPDGLPIIAGTSTAPAQTAEPAPATRRMWDSYDDSAQSYFLRRKQPGWNRNMQQLPVLVDSASAFVPSLYVSLSSFFVVFIAYF